MESTTELAKLRYYAKKNVLQITLLNQSHLTLKNISEHYRIIEEITGGSRYCALVNANYSFTADEDALSYSAGSDIAEKRIATAYYTRKPGTRLSATFYNYHFSPTVPFRIFRTRKEALKWLLIQKHRLWKDVEAGQGP